MSIVGQILDRQLKPRKVSKELPAETRNKYLEDAQMFARSLAETLNEPEGTTFIKIPHGFQTFVLSIFEWPLKTGFTVY